MDDRQNFVADLAASQGRRLRRFLAARLRNHADVADLAQEVFLRLLRVERQDKIRNPQAYLLTIAGHVLHQHALNAKAEPQGVDITEALEESEFADSSDPAVQLHVERRLEALERALARLSAKTRLAFLLQRRDGCTLDEIAQRMGISRTMVKKHLAKAVSQCDRQIRGER
ncbi:RNA polymerase sigma factor [Steroidobacter sp.]|uniref:RNA polymerase sigma factor n=1 Tax=Steroidobacter sp. TaxID=1978227 RepID=UPI001A62F607|nr:RNA polymerase sigma factor [Steroidobacter sp.]MBL8266540.1 RNA polymerase sigma factor [Steroidobacter sp.]